MTKQLTANDYHTIYKQLDFCVDAAFHLPICLISNPARVRSEVRVERLQAITEADAQAEGVDSVAQFRALWADIHGTQAWEANPWAWAVGFQQVQS